MGDGDSQIEAISKILIKRIMSKRICFETIAKRVGRSHPYSKKKLMPVMEWLYNIILQLKFLINPSRKSLLFKMFLP